MSDLMHLPRLKSETVVNLLELRVEKDPQLPYLDFSGDTYSYEDMWRRSAGFAALLQRHGVGRGDTVAAMLDNCVDAVALWFGTSMLGAIWVGVNTGLRGEFLRHVIADSDARVLAVSASTTERIAALGGKVGNLETLLVQGDLEQADASLRRIHDIVPLEPEPAAVIAGAPWRDTSTNDLALLVYTGGTTGPSKGCMISHGYVFSGARAMVSQAGRQPDEINFSPLPVYHFNLLIGTVIGTMLIGGSAAIAPRFSVTSFWPEMKRTGARIVNLLGSMGSMIAKMPDVPEMAECYGQVRVVHGVPFPPELQRVWRERFGAVAVGTPTYGCTEAFPITTLPAGGQGPLGNSGKVNTDDFEARVVDENDDEVPVGAVGELVCRPSRKNVMFSGYWKNPQATVNATRGLWFHSGDLGRFDEAGFFYFVDRQKDYLRRRGENISSQEMEAVFLAHPDIAEVAVHALPSEVTEDDVKVTAVLRPGSSLTEEALYAWSLLNVPDFAVPRYIEFRGALPMSAVGRVHKYLLREEGRTPSTWERPDHR